MSTFQRIKSILFAAFFVAIGHSLLIILLPLSLQRDGVSIDWIGLAMSAFAIGQIISSLYGNKMIIRIGHVRIYAAMAAMIAIIAIMHSYINHIAFVFIGRVLFGMCLAIVFITLESWLNSTSDQRNRATVYSIFQILYGLGYAVAPFLLSFGEVEDLRYFAVAALMFCLSLLPLTMSYHVTPKLPVHKGRMRIRRLYQIAPSGVFVAFTAGVMVGPILTLNVIYVNHIGMTGILLTFLLASTQLGSLFTQFPIGLLADRFDKRAIVAALMAVALVCNVLIIFEAHDAVNAYWLLPLFLLSYGVTMCLYPLAVTQTFELIDMEDAVPAMSTLLLIFSLGYLVGPSVAAQLMEWFGETSLFAFLAMCNVVIFTFMMLRRYVLAPRAVVDEPTKYQMLSPTSGAGMSEMDPRLDYAMADVNRPELAILIEALGQNPKNPEKLIEITLSQIKYQPEQVVNTLVLSLPRRAQKIIKTFVMLYPDSRLQIAESLKELLLLDKQRINKMIIKGLSSNATREEKEAIAQVVADVKQTLSEEKAANA